MALKEKINNYFNNSSLKFEYVNSTSKCKFT